MLTEKEIQNCKKIWLDEGCNEEAFNEIVLKDIPEPADKHILEPAAKMGLKYPPIEAQFKVLTKFVTFLREFKKLLNSNS